MLITVIDCASSTACGGSTPWMEGLSTVPMRTSNTSSKKSQSPKSSMIRPTARTTSSSLSVSSFNFSATGSISRISCSPAKITASSPSKFNVVTMSTRRAIFSAVLTPGVH